MKNVGSIVSLLGCYLFVSACATHQSAATRSTPQTAATTPVHVSVTGNADISEAFSRDVRGAALNAISHYVPNARPLTVALVLDGSTSGVTVTPGGSTEPRFRVLGGTNNGRAAVEGALPTVPIQPASIAGEGSRAWASLGGTYTITDADGRLIESNVLRVSSDPFNKDGEIGMRRDLIMRAGEFIAYRVKALTH
jgi:hypothetical protein